MSMDEIRKFRTCPKAGYHDFKVLGVAPEVQWEVCRHCAKKVSYLFKPNGQMVDSQGYFNDHIRAFAQPFMAVYHDIYPDAASKFIAEENRRKVHEAFQMEQSAKFKHAIKKILN